MSRLKKPKPFRYNVPQVEKECDISIPLRMDIACEKAMNNCDSNCETCLFDSDSTNMNQRKQFREWESNQSKGE